MDGYEDYEELTPEELEQERRRKAAARRRRNEAREQRRKKRRREAMVRCSILLIAVILVIFIIVKIISGIAHHVSGKKGATSEDPVATTTTEEEVIANIDDSIIAKELPPDRDTALEMIKTLAENDPEYKDIYDNGAVFPDLMLRYVAVNPEMKRFVIDYIAKISIVFEGNFTLNVPTDEVPLYLQFDEQWGYADYGEDIIATSGAGPTCLSMAYTYLKQDGTQNPIKIADMGTGYGYLTEEGKTANALFTDGAANIGLTGTEAEASKDTVVDALKAGKVVICEVGSGDFTKSSSYIVIRDYKSGLFLVNDPMSEARSLVGWDFTRLSSQITKMWILEDNGQPVQEQSEPEPATEGDGSAPVEGDGSAPEATAE